MSLTLSAGCCSLKGDVRAQNEDRVAVLELPDAVVCVVADGMGGHGLGCVASERAVAALDRAGVAGHLPAIARWVVARTN
jgi:serine/threonine protein phosphatase PrpC